MLVRAVPLLLLLAGLAGCTDPAESESPDRSSSEFCVNGVCETCTDGVCTGELADRRAALAGPHEDTYVHEHLDATTGLAEPTWSFYVDANATSSVSFRVLNPTTQTKVPGGTACVYWEATTASASSSGSQGQCGGNNNVQVSIAVVSDGTLLAWTDLAPGHYTFTVTAQPQANHLYVDLVVDNPPLA